jgi:hypothetical protein
MFAGLQVAITITIVRLWGESIGKVADAPLTRISTKV